MCWHARKVTLRGVVIVSVGLWAASMLPTGVRLEPGLDPLAAIGTLLVVGLLMVIVDAVAAPLRRAVRLAADPLPVAVLAGVALNAMLFWATGAIAQAVGLGFRVTGLPAALAGSLLVLAVRFAVDLGVVRVD